MSSPSQVAQALVLQPDARIMMCWWWFGPCITTQEVARQLALMHGAGIGGVEVTCIYPVCLDGEIEGVRNLRYRSEELGQVIRFAAEEARRLGMRFDLTLGSGWPFGGPHIQGRHAAKKLVALTIEIPPGSEAVAWPSGDPDQIVLAAVDDTGQALTLAPGKLIVARPGTQATQARCLVACPTGQQVKRAAIGAEGLVLDHYSRAALQVHLAAVTPRWAGRPYRPIACVDGAARPARPCGADDLPACLQPARQVGRSSGGA